MSAPSLVGSTCALAWLGTAGAEPIESIPNPRVRDGTWVTDVARALRADTVAKLNALIGGLERATGAEMAVVVVTSLDGQSVEEYTVKLFQRWGIGKAAQDNGLLLLWSTSDRRVRLEVGYGLEGTLPDGKAGAILDTYIIPRSRRASSTRGCSPASMPLSARSATSRWRSSRRGARPTTAGGTWRRLGGLGSFALGLLGADVGVGSLAGLRRWRPAADARPG